MTGTAVHALFGEDWPMQLHACSSQKLAASWLMSIDYLFLEPLIPIYWYSRIHRMAFEMLRPLLN